jgi:GNAT superfamily N-acetyltransferase
MPATLRPATPADATACALVHHTAWVETYSHLLPASFWETTTPAARAERWTRWLDAGTPVTVAEVDGRVVGFAIAGPARPDGETAAVRDRELYALYVLAAHHGTGTGQALLDAVLPPGTPAQLWVAADNPRARAFYARNGFEPDGATATDDHFGGLAEVRLVR